MIRPKLLALALLLIQLADSASWAAEHPKWRLVWHIGGTGKHAPLNVAAIGPHNASEPPVRTWGDFNKRFVRPARAWAELHDETLYHYVWEPWGLPGWEPETGKSRLIFARLEAEALGLTYLTKGWERVFDECRDRGEELIVHIGCPPAKHRSPAETPRWDIERAKGPESLLSLYAKEVGGLLGHCDGLCLDNWSSDYEGEHFESRIGDPSRTFVGSTVRLFGKQLWGEATCLLSDTESHGMSFMVAYDTFRTQHLPGRSDYHAERYPLAGSNEWHECYGEVLVPVYDHDVPFEGRGRVDHQYTREFMAAVGKFSRELSSLGVTVGLSNLHVEGAIRHELGPEYFYASEDKQ